MIAVFTSDTARKLIEKSIDTPYKEWEMVGIVLADRTDMVGKKNSGSSCCLYGGGTTRLYSNEVD